MNNQGTTFGGLLPEQLKALLATQSDPAKLGDLQDQQKMADKLRMGAFDDHPGSMAGNVYIPDIAGSLLGGIGAIKGRSMDKTNDASRKSIYDNQAAQSLAFINALRGSSSYAPPMKKNPLDNSDPEAT